MKDDAEDEVNVSSSPGGIFTLIAAVIVTLVCWFVYIFYGKLQGVFAFIGGFFLMIQVFSFDFRSSPESSSREQRDKLGMTREQKRANDEMLSEQLESSKLRAELQSETERVRSQLLLGETKQAGKHIGRGEFKEAREILDRREESKSRDRKEATGAQAVEKRLRELIASQDVKFHKISSQLSQLASLQTASQNGDSK